MTFDIIILLVIKLFILINMNGTPESTQTVDQETPTPLGIRLLEKFKYLTQKPEIMLAFFASVQVELLIETFVHPRYGDVVRSMLQAFRETPKIINSVQSLILPESIKDFILNSDPNTFLLVYGLSLTAIFLLQIPIIKITRKIGKAFDDRLKTIT